MLMPGNRGVFCQLEFIANGTLVHFSVAIEGAVSRELGYKPSPWKVEAKVVYCKTTEDVLAAVKEAQTEYVKIVGLRSDGLFDHSPMGGFSDVGDYMTAS